MGKLLEFRHWSNLHHVLFTSFPFPIALSIQHNVATYGIPSLEARLIPSKPLMAITTSSHFQLVSLKHRSIFVVPFLDKIH